MPNDAINALTAPDAATAASTLGPAPVLYDHVNIDVANQAIFWQHAEASDPTRPQSASWQAPVYMTPGSRSISRANLAGFRFWAAIPAAQLGTATQAVVTAEAVW